MDNQNSQKKTYFKMYKAGKRWLVAGITLLGVGVTFGVAAPAKADTTATPESAQPNSQAPAAQSVQAKQVALKPASAASQASTASAAPAQSAQAKSAAPVSAAQSATASVASKTVKTATVVVKAQSTAAPQSTASSVTPAKVSQASVTTTSAAAKSAAPALKQTSNANSQANVSVQSAEPASQAPVAEKQVTTDETVATKQVAQPVKAAVKTVNTIKLAPDANDADVAAAKLAAKANFEKTGQAQEIVRVDATNIGHSFTDSDGFTYQVTGTNEVALTGYTGTNPTQINYLGNTSVSDSTDSYTITGISDNAFNGENTGRPLSGTFVIPDTVTSIGEKAFYYNNLKITLNANLTSVKQDAFGSGGRSDDPQNTLGKVDLSKITDLGNSSFSGAGVTSVIIGGGIPAIPDNSFSYNTGLISVTLPDSITAIGNMAFANDQIKALTIGPTVTTIGDDAFHNFNEDVSSGNTLGAVDLSGLVSLGKNAFDATGITSVKFGNKLVSIPDSAFNQDTKLTNVSFPADADSSSSLQSIGKSAFANDQQIGSIAIPDTVTLIDAGAFDTDWLSTVKFPKNLQTVGDSAFHNDFITVDKDHPFPTGLISVGNSAFASDYTIGNALGSINLSKTTSIGTSAFQSAGITDVTLNGTLASIPDAAFYNNKLSTINIPESVTNIGAMAFAANKLTSLTLPANLKTLGIKSFANNKIAVMAKIPAGLAEIPWAAFAGNMLTSIIIPKTVKSIGPQAFQANNLKNIVIPTSTLFPTFQSGNKLIPTGTAFADQQFTDILPPKTAAFAVSNAILGMKTELDPQPDSTQAPDDELTMSNFESNTESSTTASQYNPITKILTLKSGTQLFTVNFKDTSVVNAGYTGQLIGVVDQTEIVLKSATDKTPDTININVGTDYHSKDSIDHLSNLGGDSITPDKITFLGKDDTFPNATSLATIEPDIKTLSSDVNSDFPGKYKVLLTTNGPFQGKPGTNSPDLYQTTAHVNVNQTYSWKYVADDADLTNAVDPTTKDGKVAITTIDVPSTTYTVSLPTELTKNNTTYYLKRATNTDELNWKTNASGNSYTYVTDASGITVVDPVTVAKNSTVNPADLIKSVTQYNGLALTDIKAALNDPNPTVTADAAAVDTSTVGTKTITFTYKDAKTGKTAQATATVNVIDDPVIKAKATDSIKKGTSFNPLSEITSITKPDGTTLAGADLTTALNQKALTITGNVNTNNLGVATLTYAYSLDGKTAAPQTTTVTVYVDPTVTAQAKKTVMANTSFDPAETFTSATDSQGKSVQLSTVTVTNKVDLTKAGTYDVTYTYDGVTAVTKITVDAASMDVNPNITIIQGSDFDPLSAITKITNADGTAMTRAQEEAALKNGSLKIDGVVQTEKPGVYTLVYTYDDPIIKDSAVTVKARAKSATSATAQSNNSQAANSAAQPTSGATSALGVNSQGATLTPGSASPATPTAKTPKPKAKGTVKVVIKSRKHPAKKAGTNTGKRTNQPDTLTSVSNKGKALGPQPVATTAKKHATSAVAKQQTQPVIHLTKAATPKQTTATKLPQTDEQPTSALLMTMLGMGLLLGTYFIADQKRYLK